MMLVVGDIHNRDKALDSILKDIWDKKEPLIFIGDINDNKQSLADGYDFKKVYLAVRTLVDTGRAVLVHSNHQDKLARALKGNPVTYSHGLNQTMAQVSTWAIEERDLLKDWLFSRPLTYSLDNFVFAHAYPSEHKSLAIYGFKDHLDLKEDWWLDPAKQDPNKVYVVGHYHKAFNGPNAILVDVPNGQDAIAWARLPEREFGVVYHN